MTQAMQKIHLVFQSVLQGLLQESNVGSLLYPYKHHFLLVANGRL